MGLPFLLEEICRPILGIYKSLTDTWMWKLGLRAAQFPEKEYINVIAVAVQKVTHSGGGYGENLWMIHCAVEGALPDACMAVHPRQGLCSHLGTGWVATHG